MNRIPFSEIAATPLTLRRIPHDVAAKHGCGSMGTAVGLHRGKRLIAVVDFDDLFDADGNRFYND